MANAAPSGETHVVSGDPHFFYVVLAYILCLQVIGGSGLLGSAIIRLLRERGEKKIYNLDLREPPKGLHTEDVPFTSVDITSFRSVNEAFTKIKPDVVHHTASPLATTTIDLSLFEKVNVRGTMNIIESCQRNDVKKLVFTSSSSVVFNGEDNINVDERMPYPEKASDPYNDTKAQAEQLVLQANTDAGTQGLKTVSLRPAGIFGPYDRQVVTQFLQAYNKGRTNVQIGYNKNLVDFTYVDNIAHAHLLAADKLNQDARSYPTELLGSIHLLQRRSGLNEKESYLDRDVPTSKDRPDVSGATDYARDVVIANESDMLAADLRPVVRNKYDQFFHQINPDVKSAGNPIPEVINIADEAEMTVAGQAFFITNNQPIPFWDFPRAVWKEYDPKFGKSDLKKVWTLSPSFAHFYAQIAGLLAWSTGKRAQLDTFKVKVICGSRYHNIEKARRLLGYEPIISLEEGVKRSVAWYKQDEAARAYKDPFDT